MEVMSAAHTWLGSQISFPLNKYEYLGCPRSGFDRRFPGWMARRAGFFMILRACFRLTPREAIFRYP
jgi:hypothetical protein